MKTITPYDFAASMYAGEAAEGRTFGGDLDAFFRVGCVFSTPTALILGKPIPSPPAALLVHGLTEKYADPAHDFTKEDCVLDTWLIWLAVGDLGEFFEHEPHKGEPKEFVAWARKGRLRWHPYQRTLALCKQISTARTDTAIVPHTFRSLVTG